MRNKFTPKCGTLSILEPVFDVSSGSFILVRTKTNISQHRTKNLVFLSGFTTILEILDTIQS